MGEQSLPKARKGPPTSLMSPCDLHIIETPAEPVCVLCLEPQRAVSSSLQGKCSASLSRKLSARLQGRGLSGWGAGRSSAIPESALGYSSSLSSASTPAWRIIGGIENTPAPAVARKLIGKDLESKANLGSTKLCVKIKEGECHREVA